MMKNVFYFKLKVLFVLEIFAFLSKAKVSFKIYDVTEWTKNSYNTHIAQYLKRYKQPVNAIWSVNRT